MSEEQEVKTPYRVVEWKKFHALARAPEYAHSTDSGADLRWTEDLQGVSLYSGETRKFWTGIGVRLLPFTEMQIRPRSSLSAKGILCHLGTVDEAYVGQIGVVLTNLTNKPYVFQRGDKIAQAVISARVAGVAFVEVDDLGETERGAFGFGSSGR